jgi:hypothetical protein
VTGTLDNLLSLCATRVDGDQQQSVERIPVRVDEWSPQVRSY